MPTTANFSLEYPDDNSSVDIAGHFETLADDVDNAINTRLALTGGTLTGSLSGTSLSLSSTLSVTGATTIGGLTTINNGDKAVTGLKVERTVTSTSVNDADIVSVFYGGARATWVNEKGNLRTSNTNSAAEVPFKIIGASAISNNYLEVLKNDGSILVRVGQLGKLTANQGLDVSNGVTLDTIVGSSTTDSSSSTTGAFKTAGGMGIAKALYVGTTLNVADAATFSNTVQSTGFLASAAAATSAGYQIYTGSSLRWNIRKENTAESGSDAGSDLVINRYNDSGVNQGVNFRIARSTGLTTLYGDLTISKASPYLTVNATSGNAYSLMSRPAGSYAYQYFQTAGNTRWTQGANATAESGSDAGSDFVINRYSDAGALLSTPLTITRSTGAVTLTGTLNGKVVNDLVTGPASATDNALVRFDNTTGKVVQNSGITVDDSGNITSDVTIGKADATLTVGSGSGGGIHVVKGAAGQSRQVRMLTGTSRRWDLGANTTAEGGSSAGSDFVLTSHSDGGTQTAVVLATRSTGKVTLGAVGATAGLELGTSGPRVMSGTGSPEGVVTAPVGSQWIDTAATTGAIKWIKATGSGNTGWVVSEGDTGSRDISSVLTADADRTLASTILLRRTGNRVVLTGQWRETTSTPNNRAFYSLPVGFRPAHTLYQYVPYDAAATTGYRNIRVPASGNITYGGPTSGSNFEYHVQWTTPDAWPSSLPGSAA